MCFLSPTGNIALYYLSKIRQSLNSETYLALRIWDKEL